MLVWAGFFTVFGVSYAIVADLLSGEVWGLYSNLSNTTEGVQLSERPAFRYPCLYQIAAIRSRE